MKLRGYYLYLKQFISSPKVMGTVIPSSCWLCRAMVEEIPSGGDIRIAELGAGTGVITKACLKQISEKSVLDCYEIQSILVDELKKIPDRRLSVYCSSAEFINSDYHIIISGIPFLSLDKKIGIRILKNSKQSLMKNNGVLILFQYTRRCEKIFLRYFDVKRKFVLFNVPPAWVYCCSIKK